VGRGRRPGGRGDPFARLRLVTDGDRALLGRQASWPTGRYSALVYLPCTFLLMALDKVARL